MFGTMILSPLQLEAAHYSVETLRLNEMHRSLGQRFMLG
jgi:predicted ATPase